MKIILIVAVLVIGGVVIYVASPWLFARRVTFVIPNDFRGLIRVYSASAGRPFHGTVAVPANGEIPASDVSGQPEAQRIKGRWRSGGELEMKYNGDQTPNKVFLWVLDYPAKPEYYFFIGTLGELKTFWSANSNRLYSIR